ncbi:MAG: hypothetical protein KGZ82_10595 [Bacteroidales bacterium]|nr:hypothetical protein [Bacteroidales bacterium]
MADVRDIRLKIEYQDFNGAQTRIEVWQYEYKDDPVVCEAREDPLVIEWGDQGVQNWPVVYGSTATISFYASSEAEFADLFSTYVFANLVHIFKDDVLFWAGYIVADQYNEARVPDGTPIPMQFVATDLLTYACGLEASAVVGDQRRSLKSWLTGALSLTGTGLELHSAIDWQNTLSVPFLDLLIDTRAFEGKKIGEVIEGLFYGCRLLQRAGKWCLITYTNYMLDEFSLVPPTGSAATVAAERDDFWFESHLNIEYFPPVKAQPFIQQNALVKNLILNGDFKSGTDSWTANDCTIAAIDGGFEKKDLRLVKLNNVRNTPGPSYLWTKYITQTFVDVKQSTECFEISVDYGLIGASGTRKAAPLYMVLYLQDVPYTQTLYGYLNDDQEAGLLWVQFANIPLLDPAMRIGVYIDTSGNFGVVDAETVEEGAIGKSVKTWKVYSYGIPMSGTLTVRLYAAVTTDTDIVDTVFTNVKVRVVTKDRMNYDDSVSGTLVNANVSGRMVQDEIEFLCGDFEDVTNKQNIYNYGLFSAAGGFTSLWNRTGYATQRSLNFMRMRHTLELSKLKRMNYQTQLSDCVPSLALSYIDLENSRARMLENGISYHDRMNVTEGQFTELLYLTVE